MKVNVPQYYICGKLNPVGKAKISQKGVDAIPAFIHHHNLFSISLLKLLRNKNEKQLKRKWSVETNNELCYITIY